MGISWRKSAVAFGVLWLFVLLGVGSRPPTVVAQAPKPEFKLKLMGINRTLDPWKLYQEWAQTVEKRTNGRVQFELTSLPELGLSGAETLRVLRTGVVDITETYGGYVAGELPLVEILELPGIFPDPQTAKKAILAWKPTEAKLLDQKANAVLLAMALYPDQAFFSKKAVRKPADFKGLKTRVHSVALASLVAGLGGEPLTIAFAEVYTALERGTLDAAISGTKPGFGLRWYEVSKYLVGPISMRPHVALAINKNTWKRLPPDIQQIMKDDAEKIVEGKAFEAIEVWNKEGIDKSVEKGMEHIPVLARDPGRHQGRVAHQGGPGLGEARGRGRRCPPVQRDHRAACRIRSQILSRRRCECRTRRGRWMSALMRPDIWLAACTSCLPFSPPTMSWRASGAAPSACRPRASPTRSADTCSPWPLPGGLPMPFAPAPTYVSMCCSRIWRAG